MREHLTDAAIASKAHYATYGAAGISFLGGLTANDIAAFAGVVIGIFTLAVHIWFKRRDDRRLRALNELEQTRVKLEIQRLQQHAPTP